MSEFDYEAGPHFSTIAINMFLSRALIFPLNKVMILREAQYCPILKPANSNGIKIQQAEKDVTSSSSRLPTYIEDEMAFDFRNKSILACLQHLKRTKGALSVYRGFWIDFFADILTEKSVDIVTNFLAPFYENHVRNVLAGNARILNSSTLAIYSITALPLFARSFSDAIMSPLQRMKTIMMIEKPDDSTSTELIFPFSKIPQYWKNWKSILYGVLPSILCSANSVLVEISSAFFIYSVLGLYPSSLSACFGKFACCMVGGLTSLPLQTIRTRLFIQSLPKTERHLIPICPVPYLSMWDCFTRMIHEEGLGSLYRNWQLHTFQVAMECLLDYADAVLETENVSKYSDLFETHYHEELEHSERLPSLQEVLEQKTRNQ